MMRNLNMYLSIILLYMSTSTIGTDLVKQLESSRHIDKKIILIGAGGKKGSEYFELLKEHVTFVAFIQPNPQEALIANAQKHNIPIYYDLDQALQDIESDGVLISVPHHLHFFYTKKCLEHNLFIIKEKPFVINQEEIDMYKKMCNNEVPQLFVIVQRQFQQSFAEAKKHLNSLGKIFSFKYEYSLNLKNMVTQGWRAKKSLSGGGALLDMGYHSIDILNAFFGVPIICSAVSTYKTDIMKEESLEDEIFIVLSYSSGLIGNVIISRYGSAKKECLEISGDSGMLIVTPHSYILYDKIGNIIQQEQTLSHKDDLLKMFLCYLDHINDVEYIKNELTRHEANNELINNIYSKNNVI